MQPDNAVDMSEYVVSTSFPYKMMCRYITKLLDKLTREHYRAHHGNRYDISAEHRCDCNTFVERC